VRLVKIIDNNLFQTSTGTLVRLAGVDAPSLNHPVTALSDIAGQAVKYSNSVLLKRELSCITLDVHDNITDVVLYKKYPLDSANYNSLFLAKGYGKVSRRDTSLALGKFIEEENFARQFKKGIWALDPALLAGEFKREYTDDEIIEFREHTTDARILFLEDPDALDIVSEIILGAGLGTVTGLPAAFVLTGLSGAEGWGALGIAVIGWYCGYIAGSALGVYLPAKKFNPEATYLQTLSYGALGALGGIGIIAALPKNSTDFGSYAIPLLLAAPLAAEIIYVNNIDYAGIEAARSSKILSHKDFYSRTIVFKQSIFRINF
ncbi:MAG: thermonuclease family protein, partial [Ignavibacteriaceae bacterium]|nr:thermonuclease family protein [Ignavibacteriaceae bacterium]